MTHHTPVLWEMPEGLTVLYRAKGHKAECPTCHQNTLLRRKRLDQAGARTLRFIGSRPEVSGEDIRQNLGAVAYTNYTKLKYWGLLERVGEAWRLTEPGMMFLRGAVCVPETLWIYNDRARLVPPEMYDRWVYIRDLMPPEEVTRESVARESKPIDASGQLGIQA